MWQKILCMLYDGHFKVLPDRDLVNEAENGSIVVGLN
jgi:hypothetical protein